MLKESLHAECEPALIGAECAAECEPALIGEQMREGIGHLTVAMVAVLAGGASLVSPGEVAQLRGSDACGGTLAAALLPCAQGATCTGVGDVINSDA